MLALSPVTIPASLYYEISGVIMTAHINGKLGDFASTVIMPGDPLRAKFIAENYLMDYRSFSFYRLMCCRFSNQTKKSNRRNGRCLVNQMKSPLNLFKTRVGV